MSFAWGGGRTKVPQRRGLTPEAGSNPAPPLWVPEIQHKGEYLNRIADQWSNHRGPDTIFEKGAHEQHRSA